MNDKKQLAAMGARLVGQLPPMCLQKRVEQLVALLRDAAPYVKERADWGSKRDMYLRDAIYEAIDGVIVTHPAVPEGWQLVPIEPTGDMLEMAEEAIAATGGLPEVWAEMIAAAPKFGGDDA